MMDGWRVLLALMGVLQLLILARVVLSWIVSPLSRNPLVEAVRRITDPILQPISAVLPPVGGFDLSPVVALILLSVLQELIRSSLFAY